MAAVEQSAGAKAQTLTIKQRAWLRAQGHALHPLVMIGSAGASEAVLTELRRTLAHHELVKIKVSNGDREQRQGMLSQLCERTDAAPVAIIGKMLLLYKRSEPAKLQLPGSAELPVASVMGNEPPTAAAAVRVRGAPRKGRLPAVAVVAPPRDASPAGKAPGGAANRASRTSRPSDICAEARTIPGTAMKRTGGHARPRDASGAGAAIKRPSDATDPAAIRRRPRGVSAEAGMPSGATERTARRARPREASIEVKRSSGATDYEPRRRRLTRDVPAEVKIADGAPDRTATRRPPRTVPVQRKPPSSATDPTARRRRPRER